jgi:hypothetical protein
VESPGRAAHVARQRAEAKRDRVQSTCLRRGKTCCFSVIRLKSLNLCAFGRRRAVVRVTRNTAAHQLDAKPLDITPCDNSGKSHACNRFARRQATYIVTSAFTAIIGGLVRKRGIAVAGELNEGTIARPLEAREPDGAAKGREV